MLHIKNGKTKGATETQSKNIDYYKENQGKHGPDTAAASDKPGAAAAVVVVPAEATRVNRLRGAILKHKAAVLPPTA